MWYIHIFALFELYLVQLDYKIKLSRCTPHRCSTTISLETKPIYSYVVNYNQYFYMFPCYHKRLTYEVSLRNTIHKHSSCSK